jgi:hypothetical protein
VENLSIALKPSLAIDRPRLALPVDVLATQAREEWDLIERIWRSVAQEFPGAMPQLNSFLWEISHGWEFRWALILREAVEFGYISASDQVVVEYCHRAWTAVIRQHLVAHGYEMLPTTMARLL